MTKQALVLGATGGIGGEVARRLLARGWHVTALHRDPARITHQADGIAWIKGDAMSAADVPGSRRRFPTVHAVNPPGYRDWESWCC